MLYLGFSEAANSTRHLWADQAQTLIDGMEESIDVRLQPIREQARWVAHDVKDLSDLTALDSYAYGILAATPQVAGVALIDAEGRGRRWHRTDRFAVSEDWSQNSWWPDYLKQVESADGPTWREPIFTETVRSSTLLHDIPLHDVNGKFIGVFAQIVTIEEISAFLSRNYAETGITPFVLYDHNFVLAHPQIFAGTIQQPLPDLDELGDLVLQRIWSPDEEALYIADLLDDTQARGVLWGEVYYLFLYRNLERYGPAPWTIGAYINTNLQTDNATRDLFRSLAVGLAVLAFAILAAIIVGRKISIPIKAIVHAAESIEAGNLDTVQPLAGSGIRELDEASKAFNDMLKGLREREIIRQTLGRFVPAEVASSLLAGGGTIPVQQTEATILFCDIEAFTSLTETLGPIRIVDMLNAYFSDMVEVLETHGGIVTQFQGDAILATFNVPIAAENHAHNAIAAALDMLQRVATQRYSGESIKTRIGINTGAVVAGAIGAKGRLNYTVHGDAVNLAARLENLNKIYHTRLIVSESSTSQAPDFAFTLIGDTPVRGQTQSTRIYTIESIDPRVDD